METECPTNTIYKGDMIEVWEDFEHVYLGFESCTLRFPRDCWKTLKKDFRQILNETEPVAEGVPDSTPPLNVNPEGRDPLVIVIA